MSSMHAMVMDAAGLPLRAVQLPRPVPASTQVLVKVSACAICRTDLHILDGDLAAPKLPLILGHEIVGTVEECGSLVSGFQWGERVGIPWLGWTCGGCPFCRSQRENVCEHAQFTGYDIDGGFAEYTVADARFCFRVPDRYTDAATAPLLCAGLIGYRSLRKLGDAHRIGIFGFGAAAHIVAQVAKYEKRRVYAFTRTGDVRAQEFARSLGVEWAGGVEQSPPEQLDGAIIFAPAGELVPRALRWVGRGGCVVCGGIHMTDIPGFAYTDLWHERSIASVANLTRQDAGEFLRLAPAAGVVTHVRVFPLSQANVALAQLRHGAVDGAAVLVPDTAAAVAKN